MHHIQVFRVINLPAVPKPRSFYYVKKENPRRAEAYMTDATGQLYPITNTEALLEIIGDLTMADYDPGDLTVSLDNALA
jgi:hypothetical protein